MILHGIDYAKPTMDPSFEKEWNIQCEVPLIFEVSINHLGVADIVFFLLPNTNTLNSALSAHLDLRFVYRLIEYPIELFLKSGRRF